MENNDSSLIKIEKQTFILHLISQIFNGCAIGIIILQDVILKKSLQGTDFQIMILSLTVSSAFLFSIYGSEIVNRSSNRTKTILTIGILAKLFLIILPFFKNAYFYILCITISAYLDSLLLSIWNIVFKHNYREERRSKLYSYAGTVQTIFILIVSAISGYILDFNNNFYMLLFPASGIFGIIVYWKLSKMIKLSDDEFKGKILNEKTYLNIKLLKDIAVLPIRNTFKIFKENKPFLKFESYFFLYGMAFMVLIPVIPIFLVDLMKLDYTPISLAKGLTFHSALIIFTPVMGRFHGSGNPSKFCGITFLMLSAFPLILVTAQYLTLPIEFNSKLIILYFAYFIFGLSMSGVSIAWTLSSIYYAPKNEVSNYQAVHITLTGVRGLFAPAIGYLVMKLISINYTFYLSAALFAIAGLLMLKESKDTNKI